MKFRLTPTEGDWFRFEDQYGREWERRSAWTGDECTRCGREMRSGDEIFECVDTGELICSRHIVLLDA